MGKSYYVATNGNDSSPGTIDKPWKTFEKAFYSVEPGNTIYMRGGTYKERLWIHRSGALGAPITYIAYSGETVTIDGDGVEIPNNWGGLIEVGAYTSFIRVSGFRAINSVDKGIFVHEGNNIIIDGNSMDYTNSSGIAAVNIRNLAVDKNKITRANLKGEGAWEAIRVGDCQTVQISSNYIANSSMEGIDIIESSNVKVFSNEVTGLPRVGIYVCGWDKLTKDIKVYDNVIHDNNAERGILRQCFIQQRWRRVRYLRT
jgi:hypothetical protein